MYDGYVPGNFHEFDNYLKLPRAERLWVVEDILPTSGKLAILAPPKTGKSWVALQMVAAVARGDKDFMGFPIHSNGPALYLQLDTPRNVWVEEYLLHMRAEGVPPSGVHFADREEIPSYPFDIRFEGHRTWLREAVQRVDPTVVVIDTWRESFRGDENSSDTGQDVLSSLMSACHPASVIIVTHISKPPAEKDAPERELVDLIRGSSYLAGAVDGLMLAKKVRPGVSRLTYQSRTILTHTIELGRDLDGMWTYPDVDWKDGIRKVLADATLPNLRHRARRLAEITHRTEQAATAALAHYLEGQGRPRTSSSSGPPPPLSEVLGSLQT